MIIKPMIRSNICLNAHPAGCKQAVLDQIEITKKVRAEYDNKNASKGKNLRPIKMYSCLVAQTATDLQVELPQPLATMLQP